MTAAVTVQRTTPLGELAPRFDATVEAKLQAVVDGAVFGFERAVQGVPVDTGRLRRSLRAQVRGLSVTVDAVPYLRHVQEAGGAAGDVLARIDAAWDVLVREITDGHAVVLAEMNADG